MSNWRIEFETALPDPRGGYYKLYGVDTNLMPYFISLDDNWGRDYEMVRLGPDNKTSMRWDERFSVAVREDDADGLDAIRARIVELVANDQQVVLWKYLPEAIIARLTAGLVLRATRNSNWEVV